MPGGTTRGKRITGMIVQDLENLKISGNAWHTELQDACMVHTVVCRMLEGRKKRCGASNTLYTSSRPITGCIPTQGQGGGVHSTTIGAYSEASHHSEAGNASL